MKKFEKKFLISYEAYLILNEWTLCLEEKRKTKKYRGKRVSQIRRREVKKNMKNFGFNNK